MVLEEARLAKRGGSKERATIASLLCHLAPLRTQALPCQLYGFLSAQVDENDQVLQPGNWLWGSQTCHCDPAVGGLPPGRQLALARGSLCSGSWDTRVRGPRQLLADIGRNNGMSRYSPQTLAWEGSHLRGQSQIYNPGWRTSTSGRGGGSQRRRNTPAHSKSKITPLEGEVLLASFLHFALRGHSPQTGRDKKPLLLGKGQVVDRGRKR